jgi:uncharacterized membrane protein
MVKLFFAIFLLVLIPYSFLFIYLLISRLHLNNQHKDKQN